MVRTESNLENFYAYVSKKALKSAKKHKKTQYFGIASILENGDLYGIRTHECMRERHVS